MNLLLFVFSRLTDRFGFFLVRFYFYLVRIKKYSNRQIPLYLCYKMLNLSLMSADTGFRCRISTSRSSIASAVILTVKPRIIKRGIERKKLFTEVSKKRSDTELQTILMKEDWVCTLAWTFRMCRKCTTDGMMPNAKQNEFQTQRIFFALFKMLALKQKTLF